MNSPYTYSPHTHGHTSVFNSRHIADFSLSVAPYRFHRRCHWPGCQPHCVEHGVPSLFPLPNRRHYPTLLQIGCCFLIGIDVGLASCIASLYTQELSPMRLRRRMVVLNVIMITLGQVIPYGIDAGFANVSRGWRWMVGLGCVLPAHSSLTCWHICQSHHGWSPFPLDSLQPD